MSFAILKFAKMDKIFQTYLIEGNREEVREKTRTIAQKAGISLETPSPDVFFLSPLKEQITIDQIRELKAHIFQKPLKAKYKFIVLEKAHSLNHYAQNALLKILEEPPQNAIIVLEAADKGFLLPTILSRLVIKQAEKAHTLHSEEIDRGEHPQMWLDTKITGFYKELTLALSKKAWMKSRQIGEKIEKYIWTKKLIEANVNPRFAFFNLFLQTDTGTN